MASFYLFDALGFYAVGAILDQLGLNSTFFIQLLIFGVFFFIVAPLFFKPFLKLIEERHQKTVADRKAAEAMMLQANTKFDEYKAQLEAERRAMGQDYEALLKKAREDEAKILVNARDQAKKIAEEAQANVARQREELRAKLEVDVESIARQLADKITGAPTNQGGGHA